MRSVAFLITFVAMALIYTLCDALPHDANIPGTLPDNSTSTSTYTVVPKGCSPDDICSYPDVNPDAFNNLNRCYYDDVSETWGDVGGKHSQFVQDSVYHMCEVIATFTSNQGFKKDDQMAICKPVDKNTHGKDYDRSIGVILTYRGPDADFYPDAQYCYNLMAKALNCGAGGEFIVPYGNPHQWWEAKADPNRKDCASNHYVTVL